jgi:hypothetical protein
LRYEFVAQSYVCDAKGIPCASQRYPVRHSLPYPVRHSDEQQLCVTVTNNMSSFASRPFASQTIPVMNSMSSFASQCKGNYLPVVAVGIVSGCLSEATQRICFLKTYSNLQNIQISNLLKTCSNLSKKSVAVQNTLPNKSDRLHGEERSLLKIQVIHVEEQFLFKIKAIACMMMSDCNEIDQGHCVKISGSSKQKRAPMTVPNHSDLLLVAEYLLFKIRTIAYMLKSKS